MRFLSYIIDGGEVELASLDSRRMDSQCQAPRDSARSGIRNSSLVVKSMFSSSITISRIWYFGQPKEDMFLTCDSSYTFSR